MAASGSVLMRLQTPRFDHRFGLALVAVPLILAACAALYAALGGGC